MYRIEWIKDDEKYYGVEIEDLDRAYYLAQSMTELTGVTHSVCEEEEKCNCEECTAAKKAFGFLV